MRIRADFGVGHPAADVWVLLSSNEGVGCLPGLVLGDSGEGALSFDVEARHLVFEGTASIASDQRARTVTVEARGIERTGRGKARTTLMLRVDDDGLFSTVNVEADLHLSGEVASMGRLMAEAAYRMADQVAECLDAKLGEGSRPPAPHPPPAGEMVDRQAGWLRKIADRIVGR